jgi:hypothetical protein
VTVDRSAFVDDSGETRFAGTIQPGPGSSSGDVLTSQGDGVPAQWAAGGGSVPLFVQDTDPGAVGAGAIWIDTGSSPGSLLSNLRNLTDDGWVRFWSLDANPYYTLGLAAGVPAAQILNADTSQAFAVTDAAFSSKPSAVVNAGANMMNDGDGNMTAAGAVTANGGVSTQPVLDPDTCTASDIADALNLLGFTKPA